jgi:hypothetical protein
MREAPQLWGLEHDNEMVIMIVLLDLAIGVG